MLKSMTGYGRATETSGGFTVSFELRSVNNRYLDISVRLPRSVGYLEDLIKKEIKEKATRGKIDAYLTLERPAGDAQEIVLDETLCAQYTAALRKIAKTQNVPDDITASTLARFSDIFNRKTKEDDESAVWEAVKPAVKSAVDAFFAMREKEGAALRLDLASRLETLENIRTRILLLSDQARDAYRARMEERIREYLGDHTLDESRLLTEVGIIADKIDTGEEITRLQSHIQQFYSLLDNDSPSGRTLDFLTQELNREVNTIGSKCSEIEITKLVIEAKNEIERIREQIQNIE